MFDSGYNLHSLERSFNLISTTVVPLRLNVNACYSGNIHQILPINVLFGLPWKKHYSLRIEFTGCRLKAKRSYSYEKIRVRKYGNHEKYRTERENLSKIYDTHYRRFPRYIYINRREEKCVYKRRRRKYVSVFVLRSFRSDHDSIDLMSKYCLLQREIFSSLFIHTRIRTRSWYNIRTMSVRCFIPQLF